MPIISSVTGSKNYSAIEVDTFDDEPEYKNSIMVFPQATAPVGWIKAVGINDYGLRITSGSTLVDGTGSPFSTAYPTTYTNFANNNDSWPFNADTHFTTLAEMPAHSHVLYSSAFAGTGGVYGTGPTAGYSMGSLSVPSTNPLSQPIRSPYYSTYYMSPGGATNSPGSGHSHSFSVNVGISANPGSLNLNVKYVAAIIAKRTKNTNWYNSPY